MNLIAYNLLYSMVSFPVGLAALPWIVRNRRGRTALQERFGSWRAPQVPYLWFHGASVGEIQGLEPIIVGLKQQLPGHNVLLTSISSSGREYAKNEQLGSSHLAPFDCMPWLSLPVRGRGLPRAFVFGETELWPGMLSMMISRQVPCCMVNARVRDGAWSFYRRFSWLFSPLVSRLSLVCASDQVSADRLCELGASPEIVHVLRNAKYDRKPRGFSESGGEELREELFSGEPRPLLVLGSLHPGEEEVWFRALAKFEEDISVVVAPRHMEKISYFEAELRKSGFAYELRSRRVPVEDSGNRQVLLLDTLGELESTYSCADLAFVGGTLVPLGGHNPLQPATYGVPPIVGPSTVRIQDEVSWLLENDAVCSVSNEKEALHLLKSFYRNPSQYQQMGRRASSVVEECYGVGERVGTMIDEVLSRGSDA